MERPKSPIRRCAIYTRKSSEEGLEQDFNSLHAQREACEAFIKSQAGEGWRRKTVTKHWWRTRADPFAESLPLVESWLVAEPNITAKELMLRLTNQLPDLYPTGAQLRSLQ